MSVRSVLNRIWPLAVVILFATSAPARAADEVHISVVSILATDKNKTVDDRVTCVAKEMQKYDPSFTGKNPRF